MNETVTEGKSPVWLMASGVVLDWRETPPNVERESLPPWTKSMEVDVLRAPRALCQYSGAASRTT